MTTHHINHLEGTMKRKEIVIPTELYHLAEKIEKLPPSKKKILYKILAQSVDTVVNSYEAAKKDRKDARNPK